MGFEQISEYVGLGVLIELILAIVDDFPVFITFLKNILFSIPV